MENGKLKMTEDRTRASTYTCHHLLGLIWFHVAIVLSCDFLHVGLSATSLLGIEGVGIVLKNDWLQED